MAASGGAVKLSLFRSRFQRLLEIVQYVVPFAYDGVLALFVRWISYMVWRIVCDRSSAGSTDVDADQVDRAIAIFGIDWAPLSPSLVR